MADLRQCDRSEIHKTHGWTEESPSGKTWYHVCPGVVPAAPVEGGDVSEYGDPHDYIETIDANPTHIAAPRGRRQTVKQRTVVTGWFADISEDRPGKWEASIQTEHYGAVGFTGICFDTKADCERFIDDLIGQGRYDSVSVKPFDSEEHKP
jgi:hypothetical protein